VIGVWQEKGRPSRPFLLYDVRGDGKSATLRPITQPVNYLIAASRVTPSIFSAGTSRRGDTLRIFVRNPRKISLSRA
jgi:hypothetical protein